MVTKARCGILPKHHTLCLPAAVTPGECDVNSQPLRRVLLLDNDRGSLDLLAEAFALVNDYVAIATTTNEETFDAIDKHGADLVVIGRVTTIELDRALIKKLREVQSDISILAISTWIAPTQWASAIGADAHLVAPFDLDDFYATVERLCPPWATPRQRLQIMACQTVDEDYRWLKAKLLSGRAIVTPTGAGMPPISSTPSVASALTSPI
jgi:DNA-binding response OmpR family regulator